MIDFVTIKTIVWDVMNTIRGGIIVQTEPLSPRFVEGLAHQGRAVLLKRNIDKGKIIDSQYVQTISALELEEVDEAEGTTVNTDNRTFRSKLPLPSLINLNKGPALTYVGTISGQEIQFSSEERSHWQEYRKYTGHDRIAYLKNGYLYVTNDIELRYVSIRGVFEIPTEVSHLDNPNEVVTDTNGDSPYPIPISLVPALKEMMLSQLGYAAKAYSDKDNDGDHRIESPIKGAQ